MSKYTIFSNKKKNSSNKSYFILSNIPAYKLQDAVVFSAVHLPLNAASTH